MLESRKKKLTPVSSAGMEQVSITQELNVSNLQNHVQSLLLAGILKHLQSMKLLLAERRNDTLVGESGQRLDIVGIPLAVETALATVLYVNNRLANPLLLAIADLALAVKVPDRLGQSLGNIRVLLLENVPDVMNRDNVALTTLLGAVYAQKTDDITIISVEELAGGSAIDADGVDLSRVITDILDVAEDVAAAVLRDKVSKIGAETHVGDGVLLWAPNIGREALEEDEALAVEEIFPEVSQDLAELGKDKVLLGDAGEWCAAGDESVGGRGQLGNLLICEGVHPLLRVVDEVIALPYCAAGDLLGELRVGLQDVVERGVLARCADAVREDVAGGIEVALGDLRKLSRRLFY